MRRNKFNNQKTWYDGIEFDSLAECERFKLLKIRQAAREIGDITVHPQFILFERFVDAQGCKHREIRYEADFKYYDFKLKKTIIEDVKGVRTAIYKLKRKLLVGTLPEDTIFMEVKAWEKGIIKDEA